MYLFYLGELINMLNLVIDQLKREIFPPGRPVLGEAFWARPENQSIKIDYTTPMGGCSNLYYSLIFQMPKWGFAMAKVDEWMSVTPTHADYFNLTVSQKQKLEGQIKQGLASIAQAVADYIISELDKRSKALYNKEDLKRGYIISHARDGTTKHFPLMSISLAGVSNQYQQISSYAEVTNIAAGLKEKAKKETKSYFIRNQRKE